MKRLLLSLFILGATAPAASAQKRTCGTPPDGGLILRAGQALHTGDPDGGLPGSALSLSADYLSGMYLLGFGLDMKDTSGPVTTAFLRGGMYAEGRTMAVSFYLTCRHRWTPDESGTLFGAGATADFRLAGPLGAFVALEFGKPLVVERGRGYAYAYIPYTGQGLLAWGLRLRI